jgi:hypothetical protein
MDSARARGRYLAAMGLTTLLGCGGSEVMPQASCQSETFCVSQPAAPGSALAPAPYEACAAMASPASGPTRIGAFDAPHTRDERVKDPAACCYTRPLGCMGGRALQGAGGPITAPATDRGDWLAGERATTDALSPAVRDALATHWEREAAFEHASIA